VQVLGIRSITKLYRKEKVYHMGNPKSKGKRMEKKCKRYKDKSCLAVNKEKKIAKEVKRQARFKVRKEKRQEEHLQRVKEGRGTKE